MTEDPTIGSDPLPTPISATPTQTAPLIGRVLDGRYEIEDLLGEGAMGVVYRARQVRLRRSVAIKIPKPHLLHDPDFMARFEREALTMARCVHENIAAIHDVYVAREPDELSWIVMELVSGIELDRFLRAEEKNLTVKAVVEILRQIARGLDAAHAAGIVHRDIKPSNLIVTLPSRVPKIMDFGIARAQYDNAFRTQTVQAMGTPAFMAPEQVRGAEITPPADVYALGMTIFRLFTRRMPFESDTVHALLYCHLNTRPALIHDRNPHWPEELSVAIAKALEKDPADRYATVSQFVDAIAGALAPVLNHPFAEFFDGITEPESDVADDRTVLSSESRKALDATPATAAISPQHRTASRVAKRRVPKIAIVTGLVVLLMIIFAVREGTVRRRNSRGTRGSIAAIPTGTATPAVARSATPTPSPAPMATPMPSPAIIAENDEPVPTGTPRATPEDTPAPTPAPSPEPTARPTPEPSPARTPEPLVAATPADTPETTPTASPVATPEELDASGLAAVLDESDHEWGPELRSSQRVLALRDIDNLMIEQVRRQLFRGRLDQVLDVLAEVPPGERDAFARTIRRAQADHTALRLMYVRLGERLDESRAEIRFRTGLLGTPKGGRGEVSIVPEFEAIAIFERREKKWVPVRWPQYQIPEE